METFDVRARIIELLNKRDMNYAELARKIGCDRRTVAYWSTHQRAFNADMLLTVCEALDITPNQFFKLDEIKSTPTASETLLKLNELSECELKEKLAKLRKEQFLVELAICVQEDPTLIPTAFNLKSGKS